MTDDTDRITLPDDPVINIDEGRRVGSIEFGRSGTDWVVRLHDGGRRVELNENVTFDEAAKCFWDAVCRLAPGLKHE